MTNHTDLIAKADHIHSELIRIIELNALSDDDLMQAIGRDKRQYVPFLMALGDISYAMTEFHDFLDDLDDRIIQAVRKTTPETCPNA